MSVKILNLYNNEAMPGSNLKGSHGESFLVSAGGRKILLDTGWKPGVFMHNMKTLGIAADEIDLLALSHGHRDHTGGLKAFLDQRSASQPLPLMAHPDVKEPKAVKMAGLYVPFGLPKLPPSLAAKLKWQLSKEPIELAPGVFSLGEVSLQERPEKPGVEARAYHKIKGRWEPDPILDDLSLVIKTDGGLVIVTGCCHAGLLNTCAKARRAFNDNIRAVIGGAHLLRFSPEEVNHVADLLERDFGLPDIYLNHCTGKTAIEGLRKRLGPEKVRDCLAGTEISFS